MGRVAGPLHSDAVYGPVGQISFDTSRRVQYVRQKPTKKADFGVNYETQLSLAKPVSDFWRGMSSVHRQAWSVFGQNHPKRDFLLRQRSLSGWECFFGLNTRRLRAGMPISSTPPTHFPTWFLEFADDILPGPPNAIFINVRWRGSLLCGDTVECWITRPLRNNAVSFDSRRTFLVCWRDPGATFISIPVPENNTQYGLVLYPCSAQLWRGLPFTHLATSSWS